MTNEEINKAIAEKLFGLDMSEKYNLHDYDRREIISGFDSKNAAIEYAKTHRYNDDEINKYTTPPQKNYSTYIQVAWQVVEKMREKGYEVHLLSKVDHEDYDYAATFEDVKRHKIHDWATGESASMVISQAALKAIS